MKKLILILGLAGSLPVFGADPIMPLERQAAWQGNVGIPGGIPVYPVCVNVKNAPFNAYGDGVHDDSQAIQAAIAACTNGGAVYLPPGVYYVSTNVIIPPGYPQNYPSIALRGAGPGVTTIELGASDAEPVIEFKHGSAFGTPTAITNGLTQNSYSIAVSNATGIKVGTILSITELNDSNFVSTNTYSSYGTNVIAGGLKYPAAAGIVPYATSGMLNISTTPGMAYLLWLGQNEAACSNGTQLVIGPNSTTQIVAQGTNITFFGTPAAVCSVNMTPFTQAGSCGYCGESGQRVLQQFVLVTNVNGNVLGINPPLLWAYNPALSPQARSYQMITNCGVESMTVTRLHPSTNGYGSAHCIYFNVAAWCWLTNVETSWPQGAHVELADSFQCQIEDCYFHDGWTQCSGQDYGVWILDHNSNHLIENSIFHNVRHAMVFEAGGAACVFGYNYCTNSIAGESVTGFLSGSELTHGAHPWFNLYEGNVSPCIRADYTHGSASHNTYFREHIYLTSYAESNAMAIERTNWVASEGAQQTTNGFPGGWSPGPGVQVSGAYGVDFEEYTYSNSVVGCVFTTNSPGPFYFAVTNLTTSVNASAGVIERLGYFTPGSFGYATDPEVQTSTYWTGNWDPIHQGVTWDPSNPDQTIPKSLYLTTTPSWWPANIAWPAVGPDLAPVYATIPAQVRFQLIMNPPPAPPAGLHVISGS